MNFYCPECESTDIKTSLSEPVSNYGYLPNPLVYICKHCGFRSKESFSVINFRKNRDYKIEQILNKNEF